MPMAPPRACATCGLVGCRVHQRRAWQTEAPRMRGRRLQHARAQLFAQSPLCVQCQAEGRVTVATIRDHIVPLAEGGRDVVENTQPLCQMCSDTKTQREAKRGMRRWST